MRHFICGWSGQTIGNESISGNTSFSCKKGYPNRIELQKSITALGYQGEHKVKPESIIFYSIWEVTEQDREDYEKPEMNQSGSQTNSPVDAGEQLSGSDKGKVQSDIEVQQGSDGKGDGSDDAGTKSDGDRNTSLLTDKGHFI